MPQPLIASLTVTAGHQGQTLDVGIAGQDTTFQPGLTSVTFGPGITVNTISVQNPTEVTVNVTIANDASIGPRLVDVATGRQEAILGNAFNVLAGLGVISGRLVDSQAAAVGNAQVCVSGTSICTNSDSNGRFSLPNAPTTSTRLQIVAAGLEPITLPIGILIGSTVTLGDIAFAPPGQPPPPPPPGGLPVPPELAAVLGRGATDLVVGTDKARAKKLIIDTYLLLGGSDVGVLDTQGGQLNPDVTGAGAISLTPAGVSGLADKMVRGDTSSLQEILYAFSFGLQWSSGPPHMKDWMDGLQAAVNQAWADPTNPDNSLAFVMFNHGKIAPVEAPTITPDMRLNALQTHLFISSFLLFVFDRPQQVLRNEPIMLAYNGDLASGLMLAQAGGGGMPIGRKATMRRFWGNYFGSAGNAPLSQLAAAAGAVFSAFASASFGGAPGAAVGVAIFSWAQGFVAEALFQSLVSLNIISLVPSAPIPLTAQAEQADDGSQIVRVTFQRSVSEHKPAEDRGRSIIFVYTLYRFDRLQVLEDTVGDVIAQRCSNCNANNDALRNLDMVDRHPPDQRSSFYALTVTRLVANESLITEGDDHLGSTTEWWTGFLPSGSLKLDGNEIIGPGILLTVVSPFYTLVKGIQKLTSDYSEPISAFVGGLSTAAVDEIAVDQNTGNVFYSNIMKKSLFKLTFTDAGTENTLFANSNFKDPGQNGLAIDADGNLYSDNAASDSQFCGRLFKFSQPDGARDFVGTVNYYSFPLQYGRPASVSKMAIGPMGHLFVVDELDRRIKRVPVNATYDPNRRVGQPYADLPADINGVISMSFDKDFNLYLLTAKKIVRIKYDKGSDQALAPETFALF